MNARPEKPPIRIVWMTLVGSLVMFTVVAVVLRQTGVITMTQATGRDGQRVDSRILLGVGYVLLVVCSAVSISLPMMWAKRDAVKPPDPTQAAARHIPRMALLDGSGMFGVVVYILTGSWGGLSIAAIAIVLLLTTAAPPQAQTNG